MHRTGIDVTDEGLRAWAQGVYPQEAAVELLIRTGWTQRHAFLTDVVTDGDSGPWVDWDRLGQILEGGGEGDANRVSGILAASGGELRVLRLAHSIAVGDLGTLLPGLDRTTADLVLAAMVHANGSHEHSGGLEPNPCGRLADEAGNRFSFGQLSSLHPWPRPGSPDALT